MARYLGSVNCRWRAEAPGLGGKDTGSAGGPPASIASTTVATTLTRLPWGQAGGPPALPVVPDLLRAYELSAADASHPPGPPQSLRHAVVGRPSGSGKPCSRTWPQGLRWSQWKRPSPTFHEPWPDASGEGRRTTAATNRPNVSATTGSSAIW